MCSLKTPLFWGVTILFSLGLSLFLAMRWEEKLVVADKGVLLRAESLGEVKSIKVRDAGEQQKKTRSNQGVPLSRKIEERNGLLSADYGFVNFNNDQLQVSFSLPARELAAYKQGYGFAEAELEALRHWQKKALDDAYQYALKNRLAQEQLNKMGETVKSEYKAKYKALLQSRGFILLPGNILVADIPGIVKRNVKNLRPVALMLSSSVAKLGYDSDEIIGAALSLVQTVLLYENVPPEISGRQTGGIYPPVEALAKGKGDCDTKTALLAAILLNWDKIKLVGVGVPNHYLMGVLSNPAKGDAYVEYNGLRYVLLEPAGPAWLSPGSIGSTTMALLNAGKGLTIEPLAAN